jgi:hypothetical protein
LWKVNLTAKNFGKVLYSQCGSRSVFNRAAWPAFQTYYACSLVHSTCGVFSHFQSCIF